MILPNPSINSTNQDFIEQQSILVSIENIIRDIHKSVNQMRSARSQLSTHAKLLKERENTDDLITKGKDILKRINSWEENLIQAKQKTFQDVINFNNKLNAQLIQLKSYISFFLLIPTSIQ